MKGPNCVLVPASLQCLNDVKAWNLWPGLLPTLGGLAAQDVGLGVIAFQLNPLAIDKVSGDELWHICETVDPCVIVTAGVSPVPESRYVMTAQKTVLHCYSQCSYRTSFVKTLAFLI